ncbi:MAG: hypothetical protein PUC65_07225 [Clostridiales bacterium]|nr:hypothetical protein [Clostridiales bacterium]
MKRNNYWYPVDNAGKIFPAVSKDSRSSVFRISFYLNEAIDPERLETAVNDVLPRFETFAVELKSGLFWNYLSKNHQRAVVVEESPIICKYVPASTNHGYLFTVYYYHNKVTLETFHCISDGTGAMEFLKSITFRYYQLGGLKLDPEGIIKGNLPFDIDETCDMFCDSYDKSKKKTLKEEPAFHLDGERFADHYSLMIRAKVPTEELLKLTRSKKATIGEYITALVAFSIYKTQIGCHNTKKPIKIFVPVNLRRFFPSQTLRNFSLYIKATFSGRETWTFERMLEETKKQFKQQLTKEDLHSRINSNVGIEKNYAIKLIPLFIKNIAFQLSYHYLAENINTYAISNLGNVNLPSQMQDLIKDIEFSIGGTSMAIVSSHGYTNICLNTEQKDLSMIHCFLHHLSLGKIPVTIDTNYREGFDEIL